MRVYVPLMLRPWLMDRTHKEAVHLGEKVTLAMLERYYHWVGMASSVKWWIGRCYACQARKKTRETVWWPLVSLPLPSGPDQMLGAVKRSTSSAYAQTNGMVEWLNHTLCEMLSHLIADNQTN